MLIGLYLNLCDGVRFEEVLIGFGFSGQEVLSYGIVRLLVPSLLIVHVVPLLPELLLLPQPLPPPTVQSPTRVRINFGLQSSQLPTVRLEFEENMLI